jgi:hypothetical protein
MGGFQRRGGHVRLCQRERRTAGSDLEAHAMLMARALPIGKTGPN